MANSNSIIYLHDINSGPFCQIGKFLSEEYHSINPDLQVSEFKIKKNSFSKNFLQDKKFYLPFIIILFITYLITRKKSLMHGILFFLLALIIILFLLREILVRNSVTKSLENNIETVKKLIKKENPDILIGSGWGATLIIHLIERNLWNGNAILISPSYYKVNKMIMKDSKDINKFRLIDSNDYSGRIIIYHSKLNKTIPFTDSKLLCKSSNKNKSPEIDIDLILLDRGDHNLEILVDENEPNLKSDISLLRKKDNEINDLNLLGKKEIEIEKEIKEIEQEIFKEKQFKANPITLDYNSNSKAINMKTPNVTLQQYNTQNSNSNSNINTEFNTNIQKNNKNNLSIYSPLCSEEVRIVQNIEEELECVEALPTPNINQNLEEKENEDIHAERIETEKSHISASEISETPAGKWTWGFDEDEEDEE